MILSYYIIWCYIILYYIVLYDNMICTRRFLRYNGSSGFSDVNFASNQLGDQDAEAVAMFADERKRLREEQGASHLPSGYVKIAIENDHL